MKGRLLPTTLTWLGLCLLPGLLLASPALGFDCTLKPQEQDLAQFSALPSEAEIGQWAATSMMREYRLVPPGAMTQRVQAIAERLYGVVRQRPGVRYTVEILDTKQHGACAYPGGYVFITKGLLEQALDDNGLAMVIAHEFAHIASGQMDTPIAYELPARLEKRLIEIGAVGRGFASELRQRVCQNITADEIRKVHELQADQHAIVYVALAGYNPTAAIRIFDSIGTLAASSCQPSQAERKARLTEQFQGVVRHIEKFHAGVRFAVRTEYERAVELFLAFLSVYPGREVYHNLATAYHHLALRSQDPARRLQAKCSLALEADTQAQRFQVRQPTNLTEHEHFQSYLTEAIKYYIHALEQDRSYAPAATNLACAYLEQGKYARAQGELEDVVQAHPLYAPAANNLGVAFLLQGQLSKAVERFTQAERLDPHSADPACNLALAQEAAGQASLAHTAWQRYHALTGSGPHLCAQLAHARLGATEAPAADPTQAEAERRSVPLQPGQPSTAAAKPDRTIPLLSACPGPVDRTCPQLQAILYDQQGITALVEGQVITQVAVASPSTQATAKGIRLDHQESDVRRLYGTPTRVEEMATGRYLVYDGLHLAFAVRDGKVSSWFLFP